MFDKMALVRALKFVGREDPDKLIADKSGWNDFTDDELKLLCQTFSEMGKEGSLVRALKFVGRDNP